MKSLSIPVKITPSNEDTLQRYFSDIKHVPILTKEDEQRLFARFKLGDTLAKELIIRSNLRFVVSVAKQFKGKSLSLSDLIAEGNIGLIRAVEKYDVSRGLKFISYAVWWIRQSIMEALSQKDSSIRLPMSQNRHYTRIFNAEAFLTQEFGFAPSADSIAEFLKMEVSDVDIIRTQRANFVDINGVVTGTEDMLLQERIAIDQDSVEDVMMERDSHLALKRALAILPKREAMILEMHFGLNNQEPLGFKEIANKFDLTPERVRQLRDQAYSKLRSVLPSNLLQAA